MHSFGATTRARTLRLSRCLLAVTIILSPRVISCDRVFPPFVPNVNVFSALRTSRSINLNTSCHGCKLVKQNGAYEFVTERTCQMYENFLRIIVWQRRG